MATATKTVLSETDLLEAKEREIRKTYKRVIPGTIRKETEGSHAGKLTVEIRCATRGCPNTRRVATSDLFQVRYCEECTKLQRNKKRRAARLEAKGAPAPKAKKKRTKKSAGDLQVAPVLNTAPEVPVA